MPMHERYSQRRVLSLASPAWTAAALLLAAGSATGCFPGFAAPPSSVCALPLPPLDRGVFSGVQLAGATPPTMSEGELAAPDAQAFRAQIQQRLAQIPYFVGGSWPQVTVSVVVSEFSSGVGGCWAMMIPDILLFPAWWLVGAPTFCYSMSMSATWDAAVGGFRRQYTFDITDYSVSGLYYTGEFFPSGDVYLGHTLWAFAEQLGNDFAAYQAGQLPAQPEPFEESLDPDDGDWYDALDEGTLSCMGQPFGGNAALIADAGEMGGEIGTFIGSTDPATKAAAATALGVRAARHVIAGVDDGSPIEAVLVNPEYAGTDPTVQTAVREALGLLQCARDCTTARAADCATTCRVPSTP
jgi:hypothetical protein